MVDVRKLNNGMNIAFHHINSTATRCTLVFKNGYCFEDEKCRGITHLLEHMLVRNYSSDCKVMYKKLRQIGVDVEAETNTEFVSFSIQVSNEYLENGVDLLKRIFDIPCWTKKELKQEKEIVYRQIENKYISVIDKKIYNNYLPIELRGNILGTKSSVRKISLDDLFEWHNKLIFPANSCLVISGNLDERQKNYVVSLFDSLERKENKNKVERNIPLNFCNRSKNNVYLLDGYSDYAEIKFLIDIPREDSFVGLIFANGIGIGNGSEASLIFREEFGITDEVICNILMYKEFSYIELGLTVKTKDLYFVIREICCLFKNMLTYDNEYWQDHKNYLIRKLKACYASDLYEENLAFCWNNFILNQKVMSVDDIINELKKCGDLSILARKIFSQRNISIYVSTSDKKIKRSEINKIIKNSV